MAAPDVAARNPSWSRDELLLALDVYLRHRPFIPGDGHPDVVELSQILNALPIHTIRPDAQKFRNPNGVALKLANFAALDPSYPGRGMQRHGKLDADVWAAFADRPGEVRTIAARLRDAAVGRDSLPVVPEDDEDDVDAVEGRLLYRQHRTRERDRSIVNKRKQLSRDNLACEVCGFDFAARFGPLGDGYIEAHHTLPLAHSGPTRTKPSDLALVCANCHRMLHRRRPWSTVDDLRALVRTMMTPDSKKSGSAT